MNFFNNSDQNQSQQPGAGESQNQIPAPFHAQGSQPPRIGTNRRARVQQNRYAVPTTMQYSESSQAEAGQQIDRLRHMNQPVPSALFADNPEPSSNPSNSQYIAINHNENNVDQTSALNDTAEDAFQQLANGQQDSAQPGVPATMFQENQAENNENELENTIEVNQSNRESIEEEKEEAKELKSFNYENQNNQERQGVEDTIRPNPNHQEEVNSESSVFTNDENPYKNIVIRRNEQFSTTEKEPSGQELNKRATPKTRRQSQPYNSNSQEKTEEKKRTTQPFGYTLGQSRGSNYASFIVPNYSDAMSIKSEPVQDSIKIPSSSYPISQSHTLNINDNTHTNSVSSFSVTNYEDSEFMIKAFQK